MAGPGRAGSGRAGSGRAGSSRISVIHRKILTFCSKRVACSKLNLHASEIVVNLFCVKSDHTM